LELGRFSDSLFFTFFHTNPLSGNIFFDCKWATAFLVSFPNEGSTNSVTFLATFAGSFCIKSSDDPASEFIATNFLEKGGVPVPKVRVVQPQSSEHAAILAAVESVAKNYSRRGDAEGATQVMLRGLFSMKKYSGPLLLFNVVPGGERARRASLVTKRRVRRSVRNCYLLNYFCSLVALVFR